MDTGESDVSTPPGTDMADTPVPDPTLAQQQQEQPPPTNDNSAQQQNCVVASVDPNLTLGVPTSYSAPPQASPNPPDSIPQAGLNPYPSISDPSNLTLPSSSPAAFLATLLPHLPSSHPTALFITSLMTAPSPPPEVSLLADAVRQSALTWHSNSTINHPSALAQCGDDVVFLHELLVDLLNECSAHITTIGSFLEVGQAEVNMKRVQELSHAIKGAAANLVCDRLSDAAKMLEEAAKSRKGEVVVREMGRVLVVALEDFRGGLRQMGLI